MKIFLILILLFIPTQVNAQLNISETDDYTLVMPGTITTNSDILVYTIKVQEKLRLEHNAKAKLLKEGKITKTDWDIYLAKEYYPRLELLIGEHLKKKEALRKEDLSSIDLSTTFEKKEEPTKGTSIDD